MILAAFLPVISVVFSSLPDAVLGGCTIMMFGNIIVSGFQMIARAGFTQRNILCGAIAFRGIGFTQVSEIFQFCCPKCCRMCSPTNCVACGVLGGGYREPRVAEKHFRRWRRGRRRGRSIIGRLKRKMMDVRNSMLRERKRLRLPRLSHDGMREGEGKRFLGWITEPKTAVHRQNR